ncbi:hypothetical protein [Spirosoma fluminis]
MKQFICLLLLSEYTYAQVPAAAIRRDSVPAVFPPDHMPNVVPNVSFYRYPTGPATIMQADLDNMPVKQPDSSITYAKKLRSIQPYIAPEQPLFLKPQLQVLPKNWRWK